MLDSSPMLEFSPEPEAAPLPALRPREGLVASVSPPREAPRRGSRVRRIIAKLLFVTLFAGVAALLGLALKKKLEASGHAEDVSKLFIR
jgi:hypothetical protein